jgi:hypothetical protein
MAQQSEFIESINIDTLKIIKLSALYTAFGATINSNIIYLIKLRLSSLVRGYRCCCNRSHGNGNTGFVLICANLRNLRIRCVTSVFSLSEYAEKTRLEQESLRLQEQARQIQEDAKKGGKGRTIFVPPTF